MSTKSQISANERREIVNVMLQFAKFRGHHGYFSLTDIAKFYYPKSKVEEVLDSMKRIAFELVNNGRLVAIKDGRIYQGELSELNGKISLRLA